VRLAVAIPTRSNWQGLQTLGDHLWAEGLGHDTYVFDHGHSTGKGRGVLGGFVHVVDARRWPFYRMWNEGWRRSAEAGYDAVAMLNDDIQLAPGGLAVAAQVLADQPDVGVVGLNWRRQVSDGLVPDFPVRDVVGAHRRGGVPGWAFLLRCSLWGQVPPIDEAYHIWYGDDELFALVKKHGYRTVLATGVPVDHATSATLRKHPELLELSTADHLRYVRRWGHN
jgi:GT2 family glycosyltransferase